MRTTAYTLTMLTLFVATFLQAQNLNPGDGIRLTLFNITDNVSGDFFVQNTNELQLPFIGVVETEDREIDSLRAEISRKYAKIYRNPELSVQPIYKVNVLGEVKTPGVYYLTGVEKLSDLIAMAGGESPDANLNKIFLIRETEKININAKEILQNGDTVKNIDMRSGDQLYVPRKKLSSFRNASVLLSAAALMVTTVGVLKR